MKKVIIFAFFLIMLPLYASYQAETFTNRYEQIPQLVFFNETNYAIEVVYMYKVENGAESKHFKLAHNESFFGLSNVFDPSTITSIRIRVNNKEGKRLAEYTFDNVFHI